MLVLTGQIFLAQTAQKNYDRCVQFPPLLRSLSVQGPPEVGLSAQEKFDFSRRIFFLHGCALLFQLRRWTADAAWIALLQYYGRHETSPGKEEHEDFGAGHYPLLQNFAQLIVRLDPQFEQAYIYGGSVLVWNLNRPQEGMEIFQAGARGHPKSWRLRLLIGAVIYKQEGQFESMLGLLEQALNYPDCPLILKTVLANIYKVRGQSDRAREIWQSILQQKNLPVSLRRRAEEQIQQVTNIK